MPAAATRLFPCRLFIRRRTSNRSHHRNARIGPLNTIRQNAGRSAFCLLVSETGPMINPSTDCQRLERHERGREAFLAMLRSWRSRSGLSLSDMADLCELAMRADLASDVPDWSPRPYSSGELVVSHGAVWRAIGSVPGTAAAPKRNGEHQGFEPVTTLKRMFTSQIHTLERGRAQNVGSVVFDSLGTLNHWLAELRRGRAPYPAGRLGEKAKQAQVIEDSDGAFGPEEMLAVYLGLLQPPFSVVQMTADQAFAQTRMLARAIRQGMLDAGLDLVDDWGAFVALYPTSDKGRLAKVRDVAQGRASWSPEQVDDEAAAVAIALSKLVSRAARRAAEERD